MFKIFGKKIDGKTESDAAVTVESIKEACPDQYAAIVALGKAEATAEIAALNTANAEKIAVAVNSERARIAEAVKIGKIANLESRAIELALSGKSADEIRDGLLAESAAALAKAQGLKNLREETTPPVKEFMPEDFKTLAGLSKEDLKVELGKIWDKNPNVRDGQMSKEGWIAGTVLEIQEKN